MIQSSNMAIAYYIALASKTWCEDMSARTGLRGRIIVFRTEEVGSLFGKKSKANDRNVGKLNEKILGFPRILFQSTFIQTRLFPNSLYILLL